MIPGRKKTPGQICEDRACAYLLERGYKVLGRNIRSGRREIDIIVRDGRNLVVVEVRSKRRWSPMEDSEVVGYEKRRNVVKAAREIVGTYVKKGDTVRFDVVIVITDRRNEMVSLDHIINAYSATGEII